MKHLWIAFVMCLAACAEGGPKVNRVQTNLVDKTIFDGEWWFATTVVDVSYDASHVFSSAGAMAPYKGSMTYTDLGQDGSSATTAIARIRWVIDEKTLFAFRAYELVSGGNADKGDSTLGQPLAAYKIEDHVDVRADYNPVTGEPLNIRVENKTDRKWYDRKFMRVDWSQNLLTSFYPNDAEYAALFSRFKREPVPFFIQDGSHVELKTSWAPQFVRVGDDPAYRFRSEWPDADEDKVHYMSFVTREIWSPEQNCGLISGASGDCATAAVTVRSSFLRVPPNHEYAVETLTNREFDRFGVFRSMKRTYIRGGLDRDETHTRCDADEDCGVGGACDVGSHICVGGLTGAYGETDFLSFQRARHGFHSDALSDTACTADWECDGRFEDTPGQAGSVCDPVAHRCTVPYSQRPLRPVVYHLSPKFPAHLVRSAFDVVAQWNEALMRGQRAVAGRAAPAGPKVDCQESDPTQYCFCGSSEVKNRQCSYRYDPFESRGDAESRGVSDPYDCHVVSEFADPENPTRFEDYPAAAYNLRFEGTECLLVLKPNSCDLSSEAPCEELGDIRYQFLNYVDHGSVYFAGVSLPLADPETGELIVSNANVAAESLERISTQASQFFPVLRGEVPEDEYFVGENLRGYFARANRVQNPVALSASGADGYSADDLSRPVIPTDFAARLRADFAARAGRVDRLRGAEGRARIFSDRRGRLAATDIESRFLGAAGVDGRDLMQLYSSAQSLDPSVNAQDAIIADQVSPFRGGFLANVQAEHRREQLLAARNIDPLSEEKLYNARYLQYWAEAFRGRPLAEASLRMRQAYFRAVMLHEMGHSLGLRHNFAANFDRDQYFDGYFNLVLDPNDPLPLPRVSAYDAPALSGNGDGLVNGMELSRYQQELRRVRDARAARGAGNTMTSSVMDYAGDFSDFSGLGRYDAAAVMFNYFGKVEAYRGKPVVRSTTSTTDGLIPSHEAQRVLWTYYRGGEACSADSDCPYREGRATVAGQPVSQRCIRNPRYTRFPEPCNGDRNCICSSLDEDLLDFAAGVGYPNTDQDNNGEVDFTPVHYRFCSDERTNDISWCSRFDAGESFREAVDHYRRRWEENYPNRYYRNYRKAGAQPAGARDSIIDTAKIYQHLYFRYFYEPEFRDDQGPLGFEDQYLASVDAMDWLTQIASMPDVGSYRFDAATNVYRQVSELPGAAGSDISLVPGTGYHLWSAYQQGHQGFFRVERAGVFLDKYLALLGLAIRDWGFSYTIDERFYINFYDLFPTEMAEFFGGLITGRPRQYAPRVVPCSNNMVCGAGATCDTTKNICMLADASGTPLIQYMDFWRGQCPDFCRGNQETTYPAAAIDGTSTEVLRDWATILSLAEFPVFFDTSFEQLLFVFKLGNGDGHRIPETRPDGTPTCAYGAPGCTQPDYVIYDSNRLHTSYVAVATQPRLDYNAPEGQIGFQMLRGLVDRQARIVQLSGLPSPTPAEQAELAFLQTQLQKDESFLEYLIEIQRQYGITSYF